MSHSAEGEVRAIPPRQDLKNATVAQESPRQTIKVDVDKDLYALEADDFAASVLDGKPPTVSREETLGNMRVLDEIRRHIGLDW